MVWAVKFGVMIVKRYADLSATKQHWGSLHRWLLIGLWATLSGTISAQPTEVEAPAFTVFCGIPKTHESYRPVKFALTEALASIGYRLDLKFAPPARAFHHLAHHNADAICLTTQLTLNLFDSNMGSQLNTVLGSSNINGWSTNPSIKLDHDLIVQESPLKIGYLKNHTTDFLLQHQQVTNAIATSDVSMAAKMMINQRLDVMIMIETQNYEETLSYWFEQQEAGSSKLLRYNRVAEIFYAPYLHKRHQKLQRPLEQSLEKIIKAHGGPISKETIHQWADASKDY